MTSHAGSSLDLLLADAGVGSRTIRSTSCGGGCTADVRRLHLADGRTVITKISPRANADSVHLESRAHEEAAGLGAIAVTRTIPVPEVIGIGTSLDQVMLVLEDLGDTVRPSSSDWADFGIALAELQSAVEVERFGFAHDNHLGETPQANSPSDDPTSWCDFLRHRRLAPMRRRLDQGGLLDSIDRELLERLESELANILPSGIRPGLLHGDLWSGNVHPTESQGIALIDPAAFHGDPLFELGMMRLFGGFPRDCEASYQDRLIELRGPDVLDASEARIELGRLHHLMNHWLLFGPSYGHAARQVASGLVSMVSRGGGVE